MSVSTTIITFLSIGNDILITLLFSPYSKGTFLERTSHWFSPLRLHISEQFSCLPSPPQEMMCRKLQLLIQRTRLKQSLLITNLKLSTMLIISKSFASFSRNVNVLCSSDLGFLIVRCLKSDINLLMHKSACLSSLLSI